MFHFTQEHRREGRMREKEMVWVLMEGKEESKVEREGDRARDGSDGGL